MLEVPSAAVPANKRRKGNGQYYAMKLQGVRGGGGNIKGKDRGAEFSAKKEGRFLMTSLRRVSSTTRVRTGTQRHTGVPLTAHL